MLEKVENLCVKDCVLNKIS